MIAFAYQIERIINPQDLTPEMVNLLLILTGGYTLISIVKRLITWYLDKKTAESGLTVTKAQSDIEEERQKSQREYELELMDRKERADLINATFQMSRGMMATSDFMIKKAERDEEVNTAMLKSHEKLLERASQSNQTSQMTNEILLKILKQFETNQTDGIKVFSEELSRVVETIHGMTIAFTSTVVSMKEDVAQIRMHVGLEEGPASRLEEPKTHDPE